MALETPIYLDNNATTPVDPRVMEAMTPYFTKWYGNAASRHHEFGHRAAEAVEKARAQVAELIGAQDRDIVFTSGATESNNLAIKGVAEAYAAKGNHVITSLSEHMAVIDPCKWLENKGCKITWLKPDKHGMIHPQQVDEAITDGTILISIMAANNEIGTINPVADIGEIARQKGVYFHCDATQAAGKIPLDVEEACIDLLSISAHKIYGPKGVGALYVRRRGPRVRLACMMHGGGHERDLRSGTLNTPGIVGFGAAAEICRSEMPHEVKRIARLGRRLEKGITDRLDYVYLNGHPTARLGNTVNLSFAYVEGEALMMKLRDLAVSSGSACTTASLSSSHVLEAIGTGGDLINSALRFSVGRFNTEEEIDHAVEHVAEAVTQLREISPLYDAAMKARRRSAGGRSER